MLWEHLREEEFEQAIEESKGVCILPIGCLEKHGQHLPVGTDAIIGGGICAKAAEIEQAVVFPTMYFGEKTGAGEFKGTVIFSSKLRFDILAETCDEIGRNGFKKILMVSAHGGNGSMIDNYARSVLYRKKDYMVFSSSTDMGDEYDFIYEIANSEKYDYLTAEDRQGLIDFADQRKTWGHAGISETARVLGLTPDSVRLDKVHQESGLSTHRFDEFYKMGIRSHYAWMADFPNSYTGHAPDCLNERIARAFVDYNSHSLAAKIKFLKNETISEEYHKEWCAKQK